jgi:hypothetical protein
LAPVDGTQFRGVTVLDGGDQAIGIGHLGLEAGRTAASPGEAIGGFDGEPGPLAFFFVGSDPIAAAGDD